MTTSAHAAIAAYVRDVLSHIPRISSDRQRIEDDLRAHLIERIKAGDTPAAAMAAMGNPQAVAESYLGERTLHYAPLGLRFLAALVDFMVLSVGWITPIAMFWWLISRESSGWWGLGVVIMAVSLWALASMIYFPVAEAVFGQTIGKRLFGLAVVTESGLAIGAKEAILRRIPYLFHMAIMLDAIFVFFGQKHQRVFDHVAGTVVVEAS